MEEVAMQQTTDDLLCLGDKLLPRHVPLSRNSREATRSHKNGQEQSGFRTGIRDFWVSAESGAKLGWLRSDQGLLAKTRS